MMPSARAWHQRQSRPAMVPSNLELQPLAVGSAGGSIIPDTKRLQVQFPVRAHARLVGSSTGWGTCGRQLTDVSLSLPSSLSKINKHVLTKDKKMVSMDTHTLTSERDYQVTPDENVQLWRILPKSSPKWFSLVIIITTNIIYRYH